MGQFGDLDLAGWLGEKKEEKRREEERKIGRAHV